MTLTADTFLQAFWVFTVSLPVIFVNAPDSATYLTPSDAWTPQDIIGAILFVTGLLIETFADFQKFGFRNDPANKGKWCDKGIFLEYFQSSCIWFWYKQLSTKARYALFIILDDFWEKEWNTFHLGFPHLMSRCMESVPPSQLLWGNHHLDWNVHHQHQYLCRWKMDRSSQSSIYHGNPAFPQWNSSVGEKIRWEIQKVSTNLFLFGFKKFEFCLNWYIYLVVFMIS